MKNPFEFFNLTPSLWVDTKQLRQEFLNKQRSAHPDFGDNGSNDSELANIYYEILKEPISRLKSLLDHYSNCQLNQNMLDASFLMEMMELNDEIEQAVAGDQSSRESAENQLIAIDQEIKQEFIQLMQKWTTSEFNLQTMTKDQWNLHALWYQKYKYWLRLRKNLDGVEEI